MSVLLHHAAEPANCNQPARVIALSMWDHASRARSALNEGDAWSARHQLLRLVLWETPNDAPRALAKAIERRRLRAILELADDYMRLRGLTPRPAHAPPIASGAE